MTPDGLITSEFDDAAVLGAAADGFDRFARYDDDLADGLIDDVRTDGRTEGSPARGRRSSLFRRGIR